MRKISVFFLLSIVLFSCHSKPVVPVNRQDTVVAAYIENGHWRFNKVIVWTHTGRTFVNDSDLQAKIGTIVQVKLGIPPLKSDSIMDSVKHTLIRVSDRYAPSFLSDTLTHYLHILDTLH